jgi:hypothetical protein
VKREEVFSEVNVEITGRSRVKGEVVAVEEEVRNSVGVLSEC